MRTGDAAAHGAPQTAAAGRGRSSTTCSRASATPRPPGWHTEARTHNAVAAAVAQGRADWGVTLDVLARAAGLRFVFLRDERYDVVARREVLDRPGVRALREVLADPDALAALRDAGFETD